MGAILHRTAGPARSEKTGILSQRQGFKTERQGFKNVDYKKYCRLIVEKR